MIEVKIAALVILHITRGKQLIACKIIKRGKDIPHSQDCAKQCDKILFVLVSNNRLAQRELCLQLGNQLFVAIMMFAAFIIAIIVGFIIFQQNNAARFTISK